MKRLYNPIAIYNYNKRKYFIAMDDGKIVFFKYEDGEMSTDYSKDELEVFYDVYNSLKVDKDTAINLGNRKFNNKIFETFYDVKKELYFWYEIIGGKRNNPSKEDLQFLNYKYNNQCLKYTEDDEGLGSGIDENEDPYDWKTYSYFDVEGKNPEEEHTEVYDWASDPNFGDSKLVARAKTIKRAITKYGKTIAIVMVAGINLAALSDKVMHTDYSNRLREWLGGTTASDRVKYDEVKHQEYSYELITDAVTKNENLSDQEKEFVNMFKPYFDDIGQFMDLNSVIDRLESLKIVYTEDECSAPDIAGEYDTIKNTITIYSTDSFENTDKAVLAHELFHVTQKGFSKRFCMELSNEAATREYLRRLVDDGVLDESTFINEYNVPVIGTGYDPCMKVYYLMANLFDEETLRAYQATASEIVISNALMEIEEKADKSLTRSVGKYEMEKHAFELLDYIDELRNEPDEMGYSTMAYSDEKYKKVCDLLDYYYQVKFGKTIDECFIESIMDYDKTHGTISSTTAKGRAIWNIMGDELEKNVENLDEKYKIPMGEYRFVLPRTYFSNDHPNPIIYFNTYQKISSTASNGFFVSIELKPEINEEYRKQYQIATAEIEQESTEGISKENTDNVGGMGSRDIDRD